MTIQKIPNQIIKQPLQYLDLSKVDAIALHHMAHPTADVKTVEGWHINQGCRAFGYNFWVGFDGTVYEGRGFKLGAGVENQNGHIISIGFQGDYHSKDVKMPDAQFNAGIDIIKYVMENVPTAKKIGGHGEFMATACPGKYFPLEEMKTLKKRNEYFTDISGSYAEDTINELYEMGIVKGDGNGKFNPKDNITREDMATMIRNTIRYITGK
jgi:hypothetical protein